MITKFEHFNESIYVDKFLQLYNFAPEGLKEEVDKTKELEQNPHWHPEIYVYTHIRVVTNRLENCYHDVNLTLAGFFHDLGKTYTTYFNDKKGSWSSPSSLDIITKYADWIKEQGGNIDLIRFIVKNHMRYKEMDEMRFQEQMKFLSEKDFPYVQKFATADYGGTDLECKPIEQHIDILNKIENYKIMDKKKKEINAKFNGGMVMDKYPHIKGPSLGLTLTQFKNSFDDFDQYVLDNTSEQIMKDFDNFIKK